MSGARNTFHVLALCALAACERGADPAPDVAAQVAPVPVAVVQVSAQSVEEPIWATGTIEADKQVDIGPRVDGIVERVLVDVGDRVAAGDELFRTRDTEYQIRVREAQHALELASAETRKAFHELERAEALFRQNILSIEAIESIRTAHDTARARSGQAQTALARAQQEFEDTRVRAPFAGSITRRFVDEGVMLRTMLSSGSAVVQLMKLDQVVAVARLPDVHLARIRPGTAARLHVDGFEGSFDGQIEVVSDRVDPASRTLEVRVPIANPELALKPGLFAKLEIRPEPRRALVIERRALRGSAPDAYVLVAENGRAARRNVAVRNLDAQHVEVLSGLDAGAQLLVARPGSELDEGAAFIRAGDAPL